MGIRILGIIWVIIGVAAFITDITFLTSFCIGATVGIGISWVLYD